jgi:hypothetical protein
MEIPGKGLQPLLTEVRIKMGSSAGVCVAVLPSPRTVGSFLISSLPAPEKAKDSPGFPFLALYYRRANNRPTVLLFPYPGTGLAR